MAMPPCPLCSRPSELHFQSKDFNRKLSKKAFDYYRCPECRVIFISPVPADLGQYYPESYYTLPTSSAELDPMSAPERYKLEIVNRFAAGGRLVEVGPGLGGFAYLAKRGGFEVEAIEMDRRCCNFLNTVIGVHAINSANEREALQQVQPCNVIALWHVIEHLANPAETLEAAARKLLPGGILVIAAPNPDAFQFHVLRQYWPHVDAPRHLMLIPAPVIIKKMEALGFRTLMFTTRDEGTLGWNIFGWDYFFGNMCSLPLIHQALRVVGKMLGTILSPIERREGKGSAYTLVFLKETA
jgi:2-polyprenyl-3-methyl-5-hydroxy-6-metoxy-1,4-benzoquinol methylase